MMFIKGRLPSVLLIVAAFVLLFVSFTSEAVAQVHNQDNRPLLNIGTDSDLTDNKISSVPDGPGYVTIPGFAFFPRGDSVFRTGGTELFNPQATNGFYLSPVDLPNGAYAKKLVVYYYDVSSSEDITIYLSRETLSGKSGGSNLTVTNSLGNSGYDLSESDVTNDPKVDLQDYAYYILVEIPGGYDIGLRIRAIRVDYEFPGYLPIITR